MQTNQCENVELIKPTKSWKNPDNHFLVALTSPWYKVLVKIQNTLWKATTDFYAEKEIDCMLFPITTASVSSPVEQAGDIIKQSNFDEFKYDTVYDASQRRLGSDSSPVKINIFGIDTYLSDSMQFMLEYGCRLNPKGCYYIMPSFRGEDPDKRHLCQFFHSEVEIAGRLDDIIKLAEEYIKYLSKALLMHNKDEILSIAGTTEHLEKIANSNTRFARVTVNEALEILKSEENYEELIENDDLGFITINSKGEKKLIEIFDGIVWLTKFAHLSVPFYQAYDETGELALNADLLFGIGETLGAGERHFNSKQILKALNSHNVPSHVYEWYAKLKDIFPMQTSGFGMGIERFILWVLQHDDIRDCQLVPRVNGVNIIP